MMARKATKADRDHWCRMRGALWPDERPAHRAAIESFFSGASGTITECLMVDAGGQPAGFLELNIRSYAEGSENNRVPYVEGWFVDEQYRGRGFGRALVEGAEAWARENGYPELASDTEIDNQASIAAHHKLGFEETDRVVCFLKKLD